MCTPVSKFNHAFSNFKQSSIIILDFFFKYLLSMIKIVLSFKHSYKSNRLNLYHYLKISKASA